VARDEYLVRDFADRHPVPVGRRTAVRREAVVRPVPVVLRAVARSAVLSVDQLADPSDGRALRAVSAVLRLVFSRNSEGHQVAPVGQSADPLVVLAAALHVVDRPAPAPLVVHALADGRLVAPADSAAADFVLAVEHPAAADLRVPDFSAVVSVAVDFVVAAEYPAAADLPVPDSLAADSAAADFVSVADYRAAVEYPVAVDSLVPADSVLAAAFAAVDSALVVDYRAAVDCRAEADSAVAAASVAAVVLAWVAGCFRLSSAGVEEDSSSCPCRLEIAQRRKPASSAAEAGKATSKSAFLAGCSNS